MTAPLTRTSGPDERPGQLVVEHSIVGANGYFIVEVARPPLEAGPKVPFHQLKRVGQLLAELGLGPPKALKRIRAIKGLPPKVLKHAVRMIEGIATDLTKNLLGQLWGGAIDMLPGRKMR